MSARLDPSKAAEAREEMKLGEKDLAKTMFRWTPDHVSAEPHFQRAGASGAYAPRRALLALDAAQLTARPFPAHPRFAARGFKAAGLVDSAIVAWRKAAECLYALGNLKAAAVTLESAAREVSVGKDDAAKTEAARFYAEAAGYLQEAGEVVRAADLKMRASKLCEGFDAALAMRFIDECIAIFDGDADKDVYAVDPLRKAMQAQLAMGKHASAMRTMDRLWSVWTRLDQKHNLYKLVLSRVILLLAAADPVAAQREYDSKLDVVGFSSTQEAAAAEDLLQAYSACAPRSRASCACGRR